MTVAVSVCIPAYRAERYVERAIRSALDQTLDDVEVIVVDDHSPDATYEIARAIDDPRLQVHRNDGNVGAVANWDRTVALARGRYVKLLCSDDWIEPECLRLQVAAFEEHPDAALVSCRRVIVDANDRVLFRARGLRGILGHHDGAAVIRRTVRSGTNLIGEPSATLTRRDLLQRCGPFDSSAGYLVDLDMSFRLLRHGSFVGLEEPLACFRVSGTSWSAVLSRRQVTQGQSFLARCAHAHAHAVGAADVALGRVRAVSVSAARLAVFATTWAGAAR